MFESCQLLVKECAMGTGYLLRLSLPQKSVGRKSVGRITDYSNMTSAVYHERTVMILSFRTDMLKQTVQTQIRLLLEEQSDQGLHCLLFHLHTFNKIP